jgi:hypothetical protein
VLECAGGMTEAEAQQLSGAPGGHGGAGKGGGGGRPRWVGEGRKQLAAVLSGRRNAPRRQGTTTWRTF